jgi:hypothetical protein
MNDAVALFGFFCLALEPLFLVCHFSSVTYTCTSTVYEASFAMKNSFNFIEKSSPVVLFFSGWQNSESSYAWYEGRSESNASYFTMLTHDIKGRCLWYDSRGWTFAPIVCKFCCRATDSSSVAIWQNGIWHGSVYETEVCHRVPVDILLFLNVYGFQAVDVSMVWWWTERLSSGDSDVTDRPRSRRPCIAVSSKNEERLNQLIYANQSITTREIYMELNVRFSALGTMLTMSEYHIVFAIWVPRMLTQECKDRWMQVCQDLLDCPTTPTI